LTLKAYTKGEHVLRVEATVHNTKELRCGRVLDKFPDIIGRLAGPLATRHFLRAGIAGGLSFLHGLNQQASLSLESLTPIELRAQRLERLATPHRFTQVAEPLADQPHIVHQNVGIESATSERYPQFASATERR